MELAQRSSDPAVAAWVAPLLTTLGWEYYASGDHGPALDAFERALQHRERSPENPAETELARYAVARTLLALGQPQEAAALLEQAVAWADRAGTPDGWYCEELAVAYAELGRDAEARELARRALTLLPGIDTTFTLAGGRADRLRDIAR
jgi:tetratricopeptide (TPR) repeat protein